MPRKTVVSSTLALAILLAPVAGADESARVADETAGGFTGDVTVGFYNSYYFRGSYVFEDTFNLQPSANLGWAFGDLVTATVGIWAAAPLHNRPALEAVRDEINLIADVSLTPVSGLSLAAGLIVYLIPTDDLFHTEELYLTASYELGLGLSIGAGIYGDLNEFEGIYFKAGPSWSVALTNAIGFGAELFIGGTKYRDADFSLVETGVGAGFTADLGYGVTQALTGLYNYNLASDDAGGQAHHYVISFSTAYGW